MGALNCIRVTLMVLSTFFLVAGLILTVVSCVFPGWHIVEISENKQVHQHGLWMFCVKGSNLISAQDKEEWNCDLKEPEDAHNHAAETNDQTHTAHETQHVFSGWHRTVVILLAAAFVMAVFSLLVSFCGFCNKWFTIGWSAGSLLALVFQVAAVVVFFVNGHDYDNLRITGQRGVYTQRKGYAFWCAVASIGCYLINFIFTVAVAIMSFIHERRTGEPIKSWPKSHTAV